MDNTLHTYTHNNINRYLAVVIEQTVRQLLFGPGRSCDPPVPTKPISSARQRRRVSSSSSKVDRRSECKVDQDVIKTEGNTLHYYSNDDDVYNQVMLVKK